MKYNQQDQPTDSVIGPLSRASTRTRGSSNETTRSASAEPSRSLGVELDSAGHPQASLSTSRPPFSRLNSRMDSESNISDTEASFYDAPDQTGSTTSLAPSTSKNPPASDVEHMQRLLRDQKQGMILVKQRYEQLHSEHDRTLRLVEQLKSDLIVSRQESASNSGSSGSPTRSTTPGHTPASSMSHKPHVVRRVTSQSLAGTDRAHRFLASLRNVAAEEFEERPDALNNFEYNLNATMHELHMRMERIEDLESENQTLKKELESKAIIITGLTRERSSLSAATPQLDLSFVGQLQEQIQSYENKLKEMQEEHDSRVKTLTAEVSSLNQLIDDQRKELLERDEKIITLEQESKRWQDKHDIVASSLEETEKKLQSTLTQLESALSGRIDMEDKHNSAANELDSKVNLLDTTAAELEEAHAKYRELENKHNHASSSLENYKEQLQSTLAELESSLKQVGLLEKERDALSKGDLATEQAKHKEEVESLNRDIENHKRDIEEHRSVIDDHLKTISDLEDSLEEANKRASANERSGTNSSQEIEELRRKVTLLTAEVETRKETVEHREMELGNMQAEHSRELEALEEKMAAAEKEHGNRMNERTVAHGKELKALRSEIEESRNEVEQLVGKVSHLLETEIPDVPTLYEKIEKTVRDKEHLTKELSDLVDANESLMQQVALKEQLEKEVKELTSKATNHETKAQELALLVATHEEAMNDMEAALQKKDKILAQVQAEKEKSARLVQELEDQISSSFDDHNNRLSMIREERTKAIDDANLKIASLENDVEGYRSRIASLESQLREGGHERANSIASTARKSASAAALPSPPPAIPLPPLPNVKSSGAATPTFNNSPKSTTGSPVASRHPSQEIAASNARLEEQEARIRTIEKHLHAEKQLTATLEEALGDLESQSNKIKNDLENWKKKAWQYEDELAKMKSERDKQRISLQAVEEERTARRQAEAARAHLEEKMNALDKKKKKKSTLNCF
ncbi:hypothetical protein KEM55_000726 [Ascosphaera atra]|nr:hypothetical protein KEM55_000726 [Ascosphaera atra]